MKSLRLLIAFLAFSIPLRAAYLFTYFTKNGEDGLHLAASADGYHWEKLLPLAPAAAPATSFLVPHLGVSKLMRDPCVARGPDGVYHLVWTSGWNENNIGHASTRDFLTWSAQQGIPVMAQEPTVRNSWAPEIHWDAARAEFIIFWASTIPDRFPQTAASSEDNYNHRLYFTTTRDFITFTPTKLFYDPGFSVIDATFLHADGRHWLVVKDETRTPPKKYLRLAAVTGPDLRGPFAELSAPFTPPALWVEGPTAIKIAPDYLVYFDAYQTKHYGALRSRDLKTWADVTAQLSFPDEGTPLRPRHGTILKVPDSIVTALRPKS